MAERLVDGRRPRSSLDCELAVSHLPHHIADTRARTHTHTQGRGTHARTDGHAHRNTRMKDYINTWTVSIWDCVVLPSHYTDTRHSGSCVQLRNTYMRAHTYTLVDTITEQERKHLATTMTLFCTPQLSAALLSFFAACCSRLVGLDSTDRSTERGAARLFTRLFAIQIPLAVVQGRSVLNRVTRIYWPKDWRSDAFHARMLAFAILAPFFFLHKHSSKKMPLASSSLVGHNLGRFGWYFFKDH